MNLFKVKERLIGFRPLTGNHLVNSSKWTNLTTQRTLKFPSPYGESFSKFLGLDFAMHGLYVACFRPLTGNHLVNQIGQPFDAPVKFPSPYGESFSKSYPSKTRFLPG